MGWFFLSAKYETFHDNWVVLFNGQKMPAIFKESGNEMVHMYSWVGLVLPFTEELISRPFVGENRFRSVLQAHMGPENAIGCLFFHQEQLFFLPFRCPLNSRTSVHVKGKKKLLLVEKHAAYSILCVYMVLEH